MNRASEKLDSQNNWILFAFAMPRTSLPHLRRASCFFSLLFAFAVPRASLPILRRASRVHVPAVQKCALPAFGRLLRDPIAGTK